MKPDELLPHRPPFLFVDEITELVPGKFGRGTWQLTGEEEFFAGHFPVRPVLPGVLQVESLAQLGGCVVLADPAYVGKIPLFGGIDRARFRRLVEPGDLLELEVTLYNLSSRAGKGRGIARVGDAVAVEADFMFIITEL